MFCLLLILKYFNNDHPQEFHFLNSIWTPSTWIKASDIRFWLYPDMDHFISRYDIIHDIAHFL